MPDISRLLAPASVAIVGASPTPGALGNSVLRNLERHGFSGPVHLVNPRHGEIRGRPCLASIADLPDGVDAVVLAIPGADVPDAIRALAARGAGSAIIFSGGFAESGEEGLAAQIELARVAAEHDMVIQGPNCLGMVNYAAGVPLTFVEVPVADFAGKPAIAIVSQSGAMAAVLGTTLIARDLAITLSVSTGNEAGTGVEDYLGQLIADPATLALGLIVEQFRRPAAFLEFAGRARAAGKTIVLLHPGTSCAARQSAATHTGAMACDWQLMRTKVERAGVVLVDSLEELGDVLEIVARAGPLRPGGTAVLTESGAFKALTLDLAERIGLALPQVQGTTASALREALPAFIPVSNPMDLTAQALVDPDLYRRTMGPLLADDSYAALVLTIIQTDAATSERKFPPILAALEALAPDKPVLFAGLDEGASVPLEYIEGLRALGVPWFPSPERALRALRHLARRAERNFESVRSIPAALELPDGIIPEFRAKPLLASVGIPSPDGGLAISLDQARTIAADIGYPVVLKAQSAGLCRKSDVGGVIPGIADDAALEEAWHRIHANIAHLDPAVMLDGVLVETMAAPGAELIVGGRNDPEWGTVLLVGFGGVMAELLRDVRQLPPDLPHHAIVAELRKLKRGALLDGWRGSHELDVDAAAKVVGVLGNILASTPSIREIDINPLRVYPRGMGAVALDALIVAC